MIYDASEGRGHHYAPQGTGSERHHDVIEGGLSYEEWNYGHTTEDEDFTTWNEDFFFHQEIKGQRPMLTVTVNGMEVPAR